jgi:hypothetical protein
MVHCGIDWWEESMELSDVIDYRYLAISTSSSTSISSTYILFLTKLQKKANPAKWICPY